MHFEWYLYLENSTENTIQTKTQNTTTPQTKTPTTTPYSTQMPLEKNSVKTVKIIKIYGDFIMESKVETGAKSKVETDAKSRQKTQMEGPGKPAQPINTLNIQDSIQVSGRLRLFKSSFEKQELVDLEAKNNAIGSSNTDKVSLPVNNAIPEKAFLPANNAIPDKVSLHANNAIPGDDCTVLVLAIPDYTSPQDFLALLGHYRNQVVHARMIQDNLPNRYFHHFT